MGCGPSRMENTDQNSPAQAPRPKHRDVTRPRESRRGQGSSTGKTRLDTLRHEANIIAEASTADVKRERAKLAGSGTSRGDRSTRPGTPKGKERAGEEIELQPHPHASSSFTDTQKGRGERLEGDRGKSSAIDKSQEIIENFLRGTDKWEKHH